CDALRCPEPVEGSLSKGACRREPVEGSLPKGACRREPAEVQSVSLQFFKTKTAIDEKPFNGHQRSFPVNRAQYRYWCIEKLPINLPYSGTFPFTDAQRPIMLVQAPKTIGQRL
ncbi:MAG: hypothetical protein KJ754_04050, partial [Bacteroidetes bacterium]|nr:hypothetical protein [Bacteroidota bacterium]